MVCVALMNRDVLTHFAESSSLVHKTIKADSQRWTSIHGGYTLAFRL